MGGRIRVLDDALADQIAAGEVVERPASVVKELLENAIDALSRTIRVEIEGGGVRDLRVTDDGEGMERADAELSVRRHATSKIARLEDLGAIGTLGFRGEALPSIASVSRFELTTRTREALAGTRVSIDGGGTPDVREIGCAPGTTVRVHDLFYNVPARRKFLKAVGTESAHVAEVCRRAALAHPELRITLVRDGRRSFEVLPSEDLTRRAKMVLGEEPLSVLEGRRDGVNVLALLGAPERARAGAGGLHLFVNRRPVRDRSLARAVSYAYGSVLPPGRFPSGVVYVEVDPAEVDVNVHPQKAEVRFARGREVLDAITRALATGLGTSAWSGPASRGAGFWQSRLGSGLQLDRDGERDRDRGRLGEEDPGEPDPWGLATGAVHPSASASVAREAVLGTDAWSRPAPHDGEVGAWAEGVRTGGAASEDAASGEGAFEPESRDARRTREAASWRAGLEDTPPFFGDGARVAGPRPDQGVEAGPRDSLLGARGFFGALRVLGQARRMLIVCEGADGLHVIDQHAADERVRFARLRGAHRARSVSIQRLIVPERVELTEAEASLVDEQREALLGMGIDAVLIGEHTVAVHGVPALVGRASPERILRDVVIELERAGERAFGDAVDMALATMACHGAIRSGDALSVEECRALLRSMDEVGEFAGHCPHGRPVVFSLGFSELERRLGR